MFAPCAAVHDLQVGGRSVVNADIAQFVEIRPEADRFLRLLEILGEWYEVGKIIIFVHTQDNCDNLFRDLLKVCAGLCCMHACATCTSCIVHVGCTLQGALTHAALYQ
jgi:superfamily II DNA/RNA helicase